MLKKEGGERREGVLVQLRGDDKVEAAEKGGVLRLGGGGGTAIRRQLYIPTHLTTHSPGPSACEPYLAEDAIERVHAERALNVVVHLEEAAERNLEEVILGSRCSSWCTSSRQLPLPLPLNYHLKCYRGNVGQLTFARGSPISAGAMKKLFERSRALQQSGSTMHT